MKKSLKIGISLIILLVIAFSVEVQAFSIDKIIEQGDSFIKAGEKDPAVGPSKIVDLVVPVGQALTSIGVAVLFGALLILGIRYMISEPDQKAKLKQQLIGLVVAGIVIFGSYTIWRFVYNFFEGVF